MHGVDLHFALLVALEGKADGHVLGRFHEQRSIFFLRCRGLRSEASQQLLQVQPRIRIGRGDILLQVFFFYVRVFLHLAETGEQANGLDDLLLLQRNHRHPSRSNARGCTPTPATPPKTSGIATVRTSASAGTAWTT